MTTIISDTDITNMIRELIGEPTAEYWTDAIITLYKKFGMIAVLSKYWYMMMPTETKVAATSLTANQAYVDLPTDAAKILRVEVNSDRKMLRKIEVDELWKYTPYDDGAAAASYLNVWYLEYYDSVTDFPEAIRPLIAFEAVVYAKTKSGGIDSAFSRMHQKAEETAIAFLATDSPYEPTIFGDFDLERGYTGDNPVAWLFKAGKIYLYKTFEAAD